jgi:protein TonB
VAVALHGGVAASLLAVDPSRLAEARREELVQMDVVEIPPPPPEPPPAVEPPPPPPPEPVVVRPRRARPASTPPPPVPAPPTAAPPPPNQEPPPEPPKAEAPPSFGLTLDSTVGGDSSIAVPVGNTTMTRDPGVRTVTPAPPAGPGVVGGTGSDPNAFSPVAESAIGRYPKLVKDVLVDYPPEARRLGISGAVVFRLGIDRRGQVRSVKVISRAGHGMDEAAEKGMWKFKFEPCALKSGEPVDCVVTWKYRFSIDR